MIRIIVFSILFMGMCFLVGTANAENLVDTVPSGVSGAAVTSTEPGEAPVRRFMSLTKYKQYPVEKARTPPSSTSAKEVILARENKKPATSPKIDSSEIAQQLLAIFSEASIDQR